MDAINNKNIIIITCHAIVIGILTNRIIGNNSYNPKTLDAAIPSNHIINPDFIIGLHQGKVTMINIEMIISYIQSALSHLLKE